MKTKDKIVIIGAGPAGLGTAYELSKNGKVSQIIDKNDVVGGLARSYKFKGHDFDIGPHRFYTKNSEVFQIWSNLLGANFVEIPRLTRILYKNKLFLYPIKLQDVFAKLGPRESFHCAVSYFYAQAFSRKNQAKTFEDWISQQFGHKLYRIFFKTYTEKVWGIPCTQIGSEWAAQRIKNLNFYEVVVTALLGQKKRKAKSLIDKFYYPKNGAGGMYQKMAQFAQSKGSSVMVNTQVVKINHHNNQINSVEYQNSSHSKRESVDYLFSSMPLTHFIQILNPKPPQKVLAAAKKLYYRDHVTVNLVIKNSNLFKDNWIYVHSPEVKMARITNYNSFHLNKSNSTSAIAVEYFAFKDDKLWKMSDEDLIKLALDELNQTGLVRSQDFVDGFVIRETESYPTYYLGHQQYFKTLKDYVSQFKNLQLIGRGGMYKYNNMDHSIYTGILAARNYLAGKQLYDVWQVNEDAQYLEEESDKKN